MKMKNSLELKEFLKAHMCCIAPGFLEILCVPELFGNKLLYKILLLHGAVIYFSTESYYFWCKFCQSLKQLRQTNKPIITGPHEEHKLN